MANIYGGMAQLVRAHGSHPWGRWFESNCLHHLQSKSRNDLDFLLSASGGDSWTATNKLWLTALPCEPTFVADREKWATCLQGLRMPMRTKTKLVLSRRSVLTSKLVHSVITWVQALTTSPSGSGRTAFAVGKPQFNCLPRQLDSHKKSVSTRHAFLLGLHWVMRVGRWQRNHHVGHSYMLLVPTYQCNMFANK